MKNTTILILIFLSLQTVSAQRVEVPTTTKEAERIMKEDRELSGKRNLYFAEDKKCRTLISAKNFVAAEPVCKAVISFAEKLPESSYLERSSAYESLAVVLLWQSRAQEAIPLLEKSLEAAKPILSDTDAETGERYFWLGQANQLLGKIETAREFYDKAETTYRKAFVEIKDDDIRFRYPKVIKNILEAHLILVKDAGLLDAAVKIQMRINALKTEFPKFLNN